MVAGIHRSLEGHGTDMEGPSLQPGHKHLVVMKTTTSAPGTRIDVAEGSQNHEADESRSRALGVFSAVALLPALGVDVHPSGRLCLIQANHHATPWQLPLAAAGRQTQLPTYADAVAKHLGASTLRHGISVSTPAPPSMAACACTPAAPHIWVG